MNREQIDKLLEPRWVVLADYPGMDEWEVDELLDTDWSWHDKKGKRRSISQYPNLFRKLEWWERRKAKEMPNYLKIENYDSIFKVQEWVIEQGVYYARLEYPAPSHTLGGKFYKSNPATEEEYNQYTQSQNPELIKQ